MNPRNVGIVILESDLLVGAIDLHVHGSPDIAPRQYTDIEIATHARNARMRGLVLKSHIESTVGRARLASDVTGFPVFGGLVIGPFTTGGLDPDVVDLALDFGARIIWMPTLGSDRHQHVFGKQGQRWTDLRDHPASVPINAASIRIDASSGKILGQLQRIAELVARNDAVLATGHLSEPEIYLLGRLAQQAGARFLINHPDYVVPGLTTDQQLALAHELPGAIFERSAYTVSGTIAHSVPVQDIADRIIATGPDRNIITSDYGQPSASTYPDNLRSFMLRIVEHSVPAESVAAMVGEQPAALLGIT